MRAMLLSGPAARLARLGALRSAVERGASGVLQPLRPAWRAPTRPSSSRPSSAELWEAYGLLNLRGGESEEEVKRAYHVQAVRWHPDRAGGCAERFKRLSAALELVRASKLDSAAASPGAGGRSASASERWREHVRRRADTAGRRWARDDEYTEDETPEDKSATLRRFTWLWRVAVAYLIARVVLICVVGQTWGEREQQLRHSWSGETGDAAQRALVGMAERTPPPDDRGRPAPTQP